MFGLNKDFEELIKIMERLRSPDGCPWDRQQSHSSLKRYLIEEVYEFIDALEEEDDSRIREELGDILIQILFHSQIAKERGAFDISGVIDGVKQKLIKRHPHIFSDKVAETPRDVELIWEENKNIERQSDEPLESLPRGMPALLNAYRAGERMSSVGFDWERAEDVIAKVREEVKEVEDAVNIKDKEMMENEIGDLLFVVANLSRKVGIDPEGALKKTIDRAIKRFSYIVKELKRRGKKPSGEILDEMEYLWQKSKDITG
ncbi:MAG: nucleoside triphosphate pyrophosphohydrolase [bacterium]